MQMQRMPSVGTGPELAIRALLHKRGMRFRVAMKTLPGKPDIALTKAKMAVFVDGCFWHFCPDHGTLPKNNGGWWLEKLEGNRERDSRKDDQLQALGWEPLHIWEHTNAEEAADLIERRWRQRPGRL
jgi:DNA mismatch endonuclease (patch repair protein)